MPKKQNDSQKSTISVRSEIQTPARICDSRCRICSSDFMKEIHDLRKAGKNYEQIKDIMKTKDFEISSPSLSRHFQNYQKQKDIISAQIINDDLIDEATQQSAHTKQLVSLINKAFKIIEARLETGGMQFDISDLDKLLKLRYQVLSGQDADESDVLAIFQKASDKFGLNINQGVLFKPAKAKQLEINSNT